MNGPFSVCWTCYCFCPLTIHGSSLSSWLESWQTNAQHKHMVHPVICPSWYCITGMILHNACILMCSESAAVKESSNLKKNGKTKTNPSQRSRHKLRLLPHKKRPTVVNHQTVKVCSLTVFLSVRDYLSYICLPGWQNEKAKPWDNCGKGQQVTGVQLCNLRQVVEKNCLSGLVYCECVCIRQIWDKSRRVL